MRSKGMEFWGGLDIFWGVLQALAQMCTRLKKIDEKRAFFGHCGPEFFILSENNFWSGLFLGSR